MLEDQPLDLSVRVGDYAELAREDNVNEQEQRERKDNLPVDDYGNAAAALRLRGCFVGASATSEYTQEREDRTCSEDSDDSCSDNNQKDEGGTRSRSRPPGTKPYKKNLMRRYRESLSLPAFCATEHVRTIARDVLSLSLPSFLRSFSVFYSHLDHPPKIPPVTCATRPGSSNVPFASLEFPTFRLFIGHR